MKDKILHVEIYIELVRKEFSFHLCVVIILLSGAPAPRCQGQEAQPPVTQTHAATGRCEMSQEAATLPRSGD